MNQDERLAPIYDIYVKYFGDDAELIIDAGTRDGHDAKYLADKLKAKRVVAIDANPIAYEKTKRNYPEFEVIETAISNFEGIAKFTQIVSDREDWDGSSSLARWGNFSGATYNEITVDVTTMKSLLDNLGINEKPIDVIKVDLEGYTYECLEGMGDYIDQTKLFHLETEKYVRHPNHKQTNAVVRFMEQRGFQLEHTSYEWANIEDQIWVNPRLFTR